MIEKFLTLGFDIEADLDLDTQVFLLNFEQMDCNCDVGTWVLEI